jgi:hypothetical protein
MTIVDASVINVQITAISNGNVIDTCFVPVSITDPTDACGLSSNDFELKSNINIYPNPTSDYVQLSWEQVNIDSIEIFDINGKLIIQESVENSVFEKTIDLTPLASSTYFIKIKSGSNTLVEKIIKR